MYNVVWRDRITFLQPAACWEKYDVRYDDGRPGSGGEYPVQQGFGWTNGALLDLIYKYGIPSQYTVSSSKLFLSKHLKGKRSNSER